MMTSTRPCDKTLCGRHVFVALGNRRYRKCPCGEEPTADERTALDEGRQLLLIEERALAAARIRRGA
ncbi:MAG: hypothetical protein NUW22_01180 [Acidobacteria bacterium]|nr:hypothetical protein [Acidobacteriota bacterium]